MLISRSLRRFSTCTQKFHKWTSADTITHLKSRFKGYCIPIVQESDVAPAIEELYTLHKKLGKATHPAMYAWKTAESNKGPKVILRDVRSLRQGYNDCGEGGSGDRLMGLLDRMRLVNVLVAVTRWYGGTPLGPSRFRCISDSALTALRDAGYADTKTPKGYWVDVQKLAQASQK